MKFYTPRYGTLFHLACHQPTSHKGYQEADHVFEEEQYKIFKVLLKELKTLDATEALEILNKKTEQRQLVGDLVTCSHNRDLLLDFVRNV